MKFHVGQTVIHPHHGPAVVAKVMTRTVRGEQVEYAELEVVSSKLSISLPVAKADEIASRSPFTESDRLPMSASHRWREPQWSRRYKANRASTQPLQRQQLRDLVRRRERGSLAW